MRTCRSLVAVGLVYFGNSAANAAVVINAVESGSNVVFSYSGSINLTGLPQPSFTFSGSYVDPSTGEFFSAPGNYVNYLGSAVSLLSSFGTGSYRASSSNSGAIFSLQQDIAGLPLIGLPVGYQSNSLFSGSTTFANTTFSGLNVTQGPYTTTLSNYDTITMNIGAVPAPLPLLGLGAATAFSRKLKQRIAGRRKREEVGEAA